VIDYATDSNTVANTYTWGLDLSGQLQGAGGVGGLLCVTENPASSTQNPYYPSYDANGNISEYIDDSDSVVAHYEYSPFGKLTSSSGSQAGDFRHRFSTKYQDSETNLYYYGYRYYSSELGRWLNRDPVAESGGLNLYLFVRNNSLALFDPFGLKECCINGELVNVDCNRVGNVREDLLDSAAEGIKDLGDLDSNYEWSKWMNRASLGQSVIGAGMTLTGLGKSLIANAGKTAPRILPSSAGAAYVPLQAVDDTGKMVPPHLAAQSAKVARNSGAKTIGAATAGKTIAKHARDSALKRTAKGASWVLDPAGTSGRELTKITDNTSESIYTVIQNLQDMVRNIDRKYKECCPAL